MIALSYRPYRVADKAVCLALFDMNCPEYFAANEKADYCLFLDSKPVGYELCTVNGSVAGAFGLTHYGSNQSRIDWILLDLNQQGAGVGTSIMTRVIAQAIQMEVATIHIATSHKAFGFFEKFGAITVSRTDHGWGAGMHKIEMELRL